MPSEMVAELAAAVRAEVAAARALTQAKENWRASRRHTVESVVRLRGAGVPLTRAATIVAREIGLPADVGHRKRIAARLRDRLYRQSVVHADANLPRPSPSPPPVPLPSSEQAEASMAAKLIRKTTVTLEFVEDGKGSKASKDDVRDVELETSLDGLGDVDGLDDEDFDEEDGIDDGEPTPSPRRRARRTR